MLMPNYKVLQMKFTRPFILSIACAAGLLAAKLHHDPTASDEAVDAFVKCTNPMIRGSSITKGNDGSIRVRGLACTMITEQSVPYCTPEFVKAAEECWRAFHKLDPDTDDTNAIIDLSN
jgi:hypothetical protein